MIEVVDEDENAAIAVDEFEFFNDETSCLPACMEMKVGVCEGKTCYRFEDDQTPYEQVKASPLSEVAGVYCRAAVEREGSKIGPGLEKAAENGSQELSLDYLAAGNLPRCMSIHGRGSHFAISTYDPNIGDKEKATEFAYTSFSGGDMHCVYETLKPRCVDFSKPAATFKQVKKAACVAEYYEDTCFDVCVRTHCTNDVACGRSKSFQDCARCCGSNNNQVAGCFRRRRRLGTAASPPSATMSHNQCAINCLNTAGCVGFLHQTSSLKSKEGVCQFSRKCDWTQRKLDHFTEGRWWILRALDAQDLTSKVLEEKQEPPQKKRRRKKKGGD